MQLLFFGKGISIASNLSLNTEIIHLILRLAVSLIMMHSAASRQRGIVKAISFDKALRGDEDS